MEEQKQSLCALADRCQESRKETKVIKAMYCDIWTNTLTGKGLLLTGDESAELPCNGIITCGITNTTCTHGQSGCGTTAVVLD